MDVKRAIADLVFDGCKHYHIENIGELDERIYCDLGNKLHYGCIQECVECKEREKEHHYYG